MFRYLRDPLFGLCWCFYGINRWILKPSLPAHESFFRGHFNDLLLIPCLLPPVLLLHRRLSLRRSDSPPSAREIALHLLVWSIYFELIAPLFVARATGDALDVLAYGAGALVAWTFWNRREAIAGWLRLFKPYGLIGSQLSTIAPEWNKR